MAISADIWAVPRLKNAIVDDSDRDASKRYAVREWASTKCVSRGQTATAQLQGDKPYHRLPICVTTDIIAKTETIASAVSSYDSFVLVRSVTRDIE